MKPEPEGMEGWFFHRDGTPLADGETWLDLFNAMHGDESHPDYYRVARSEDDGVQVSTVFLGMNHAFGDGDPVLFETMIFGGPRDQECWRWHSDAEARAGHELVVASLRVEAEQSELPPPQREHHASDGHGGAHDEPIR